MILFQIAFGAMALTFGSFLAAALFCAACWNLFRLFHYPEWGPVIVLGGLLLAAQGTIPRNEFLGMTFVFAALIAIPLWFVGRREAARPDIE